jgi:hypothetical protein
MLGNIPGFATLVKKEAPPIIVTHCLLQTCIGNKHSSNNPERSFVNSHKSHQLYQKQVSELSDFENIQKFACFQEDMF